MKRLIVLIVAGVVAVAGLAGLAVVSARSAASAVEEIDALGRVRVDAGVIRRNMIAMSNSRRGYLLDTNQTGELTRKDEADEGLVAAVERINSTTKDATLLELTKAIGDFDHAELHPRETRVMEMAATDPSQARRLYFDDYLPVREQQDVIVDKLESATIAAAEARLADARTSAARSSYMALIAGLLTLAMLGWSAWSTLSVSRQLASASLTLSDTADGVLRTSREVGRASQSLSQGATEQAASIEETSASMEEMSSMTRKNADNSRDAANLMGDVDARVQASNRSLGEMVNSMASIQDASQQVAKIIKTIDEIAFQTNILALNAAVEAARAGEAGMGFAVVADEVRKLAQRSAQAARDTAGLIDASLARTQAGTKTVQQVADAIGAITDSVSKVKVLVDEVSAASQQQSQGIEQVTQAIAQMEKVTQTTAATAEESAASSEELNSQAEQALRLVEQLKAVVGSGAAGAAANAPAFAAAAAPAAAAKAPARMSPAPTSGRVVRMPAPKVVSTAEAAIPFDEEDTGTFGRF